MIKIHAGLFKGINIKRVKLESTKETASMVREAVFNMLYEIKGDVLDLFAGSGSLGITAISLGASSATFVDSKKEACLTIKDNLLKIKRRDLVLHTNYLDFLKNNQKKFDLILLDPPYDFDDYEALLENVSHCSNLNAKIVLEIAKKTKYPNIFNNFILNKDKVYGSKRIIIYTNSLD